MLVVSWGGQKLYMSGTIKMMPGTDSTTMAESFDVRFRLKSANGDDVDDEVVTKESPCCNYTFPHSSISQTAIVQVRTKHDKAVGEWSQSSKAWATTSTCTGNDYLYRGGFKTPKMICDDEDMKHETQPVLDPTEWKCCPCPNGASCRGETTWKEVKAEMGYWRYEEVGIGEDVFVPCLYDPQPSANEKDEAKIEEINKQRPCLG